MRRKAKYSGLFSPFSVTRKLYVLLCICGIFIVATPLLLNWKKPYCANSESCIRNLSGAYEPTKVAEYMGINLLISNYFAEKNSPVHAVLGTSTLEGKHIYVNLSNQELTAYEGNKVVFDFPISSGKWYPTPTGDFRIWIKLRYTRMSGGDRAIGTYYSLPNVPFTMFFSNDKVPRSSGFALHGAYWHNNFGHPMSHGCVNISPENAEKLYNWANPPTTSNSTSTSYDNPGTPITIYGSTPSE